MTGSGTITLLVTDLVGSVELRQRLGDDDAEEHRRTHFSVLRRALAGRGGHEVKNLGDGLMVAFPSAAEAVGCAVAIQQAVEQHNTTGHGHAIEVKVGLNVGDATHEDDDYFGLAVDVAHRLCNVARGGQIIASDLVRGLVGTRGGHSFHTLGAVTLKGLDEPLNVYEVGWSPVAMPMASLPAALARYVGTPFVGREHEVDLVLQRWETVAAGARELVLVSGEPGIGKTRLAAEACRAAFDGGATVLFGRCDEDAALPYQPFVDALGPHLGADPVDALRRRAGFREAHRAGPAAVRLSLGGEDIERYQFYESIATLLDDLAVRSPLVLVLDDIHWADRPTLALLRHLLRRPLGSPLLVLGTYRETELGRTHPLSEVVDALQRDDLAFRLALGGLREDDVAELLDALNGDVSPRSERVANTARAIYVETDGNPFFVEQVCRHLADPGGRGGIPQGVKDAIGRRLSRLSTSCNEVLAVAAVIGREFDIEVLTLVTERPEDALLAAVDEALLGGVVDEVPMALDRWTFTHALLRETLHEELSTSTRVRLHRRIAQAIEDAHAADLEPYLSVLAYHYHEAAVAGDVDKAIAYAVHAAHQAANAFAIEEVRRLYELALGALDLEPTPDPRRRCELLLDLSDACGGFDWPASHRAAREALELARNLDDPLLFGRATQTQFGFDPATVDEEQIALVKEAIERLPPGDSGLRAVMLAGLAISQMLVTDLNVRREWAREAVDMVRRVGTPDEQSFVLRYSGPTLHGGWTRSIADEMLAISGDNLAARTWALLGRLSATMREGDRAAMEATVAELDLIVDKTHSPELMYERSVFATSVAILEGRLEDARELNSTNTTLGGDVFGAHPAFAQWVSAVSNVQEFARLVEAGEFELLEPGARLAVEAYPLVLLWRATLAMVLAHLGQSDEASELVSSMAEHDFKSVAQTPGADYALSALARTVSKLGAVEHAPALHRRLLALPNTCVLISYGPSPTYFVGAVAHHRGLISAVMASYDEADQHFTEALSVHEAMGARPWAAHTQFELARVLRRRGAAEDTVRASSLIDKARATATEVGMNGLLRDIDGLRL